MKKIFLALISTGMLLISGCTYNQLNFSDTSSDNASLDASSTELIGGQKDQYGCLTPAGYSWCPSTKRCQRMWEEYCAEYKNQYRGTIPSDTESR